MSNLERDLDLAGNLIDRNASRLRQEAKGYRTGHRLGSSLRGLFNRKPGESFLGWVLELTVITLTLMVIAAALAALVCLTVGLPAWGLRFVWNAVAPAHPLSWPVAIVAVLLIGWLGNLFRSRK